jgi:hypothetical protein
VLVRSLDRCLIGACAVLLGSSSCAPTISTTMPARRPRSALVVDARETADCLRRPSASERDDELAIGGPVDDPELAGVLEHVPPDVRRTARAAGLESLLARLLRAQTGDEDAAGLDIVAMRLQVVTRMSSLEIQLSSLTFEVGCMGRQMDQALIELDRREQRQQLALAIASLVVGSAAGIGAGAWQLSDRDAVAGPAALGITAGSISAGLGIAAFVPRRGGVIYVHERNPLAPLGEGTDPDQIYPPFVFRMLTEAGPAGEQSLRDELLGEWRRILDDKVPEREREREVAEAIVFGKGGMYDRDLIEARERMLDALESDLDGIERDLELLYRFLAIVLEDRSPASG